MLSQDVRLSSVHPSVRFHISVLYYGIEWLHTARFSCWHHVRPSASQLQAGTEAMQLNTDQPVYAIK